MKTCVAAFLFLATVPSLWAQAVVSRGLPYEAAETIQMIREDGFQVKTVAFTDQGGWSILYGTNGSFNRNIPRRAHEALKGLESKGQTITCIAFTQDGGWVILFGKNGSESGGPVPEEALAAISKLAREDQALKYISFSGGRATTTNRGRFGFLRNQGDSNRDRRSMPQYGGVGYSHDDVFFGDEIYQPRRKPQQQSSDRHYESSSRGIGWSILYGSNGFLNYNVPDEFEQAIRSAASQGAELKCVSLSSRGGWSFLYGRNGFAGRNIPRDLEDAVAAAARNGRGLDRVFFAPGDGWVVIPQ